MIFDLDSMATTRHGIQRSVEIGYNPKRHGIGSHLPLFAFVAEAKMVANAWKRTGDSHSGTDFTGFFDEPYPCTKV